MSASGSVHDATVVVGGRHGEALASGQRSVHYLATMTELAALASKLVHRATGRSSR